MAMNPENMSRLDYFAGVALQGLLTNPSMVFLPDSQVAGMAVNLGIELIDRLQGFDAKEDHE